MGRHRDVEERGRRSGDLESSSPKRFCVRSTPRLTAPTVSEDEEENDG